MYIVYVIVFNICIRCPMFLVLVDGISSCMYIVYVIVFNICISCPMFLVLVDGSCYRFYARKRVRYDNLVIFPVLV